MKIVRFVTALVLLGVGLGAVAVPATAYPAGIEGTATINKITFEPGDTVVVKVQHTTPGAMTMLLFSSPVTIGTGTVRHDATGTVKGVIPANYSGAHTIQVEGAGGEIYPFDITVDSPSQPVNCSVFPVPPTPQTDRHTITVPGCLGGIPGETYRFDVQSGGDWHATFFSTAADTYIPGESVTDPDHALPCGVNPVAFDVFDSDGTEVGSPETGASYGIDVQCADSGLFRSLAPARVLDTRTGNGAPTAKIGAGKTVTVQLTGRGGLPAAGVGAVVLNVTVTNPTGSGYISVYPAGGTTPVVSSLNFVPSQSVPNAVTVPVSDDGRATFYNGSGGTVDLISDVSGYFLAGTPTAPGAFASVAPTRVLDTRSGNGAPKAKVGAGATLAVQLTGRGGLPTTGVASVVMNTTVTNPTGSGYLTAYPSGTTRPVASSLNFTVGQTAPNAVTVPVGTDGRVAFYNGSGGTLDLLADVSGYYLAGTPTAPGAFVSLTSTRVLDTRAGNGAPAAKVAVGGSLTLQLSGRGGLPVTGVASVVLNTTVTNPTGHGYITVYPAAGSRPVVSSLNFVAGQTIPNAVTVPVSTGGQITLYNGSSGTVDLLADVAGYYLSVPPA